MSKCYLTLREVLKDKNCIDETQIKKIILQKYNLKETAPTLQ